jgi:quercetin dioxygenase-like cupin family protein
MRHVMSAEHQVMRQAEWVAEPQEWGQLVWMVSGPLGNSQTMTFGRCYIHAGSANPRHYHPNCDEILHVLTGEIEHSLGDETIRMGAGDTISIPAGTLHNARNVGAGEAVFAISFSSAYREVVGE